MLGVAGGTGVGSHVGVGADRDAGGRDLGCGLRVGVGAQVPAAKGIEAGNARHTRARGVMTGQAKRAVDAIQDQEVLRVEVPCLNVRIVAGGTFNISMDHFDGVGGVKRPAGLKFMGDIDVIGWRHRGQAERMREAHISAEDIRREQGTGSHQTVCGAGAGRHRSIVATEAAIAGLAKGRLNGIVLFG